MSVQAARPKLLAVDDQPGNLIALRRLLARVDADVVAVRSGREALERVAEEEFALVLLDVQMPEMDGYDVAERLRRLDNGVRLPIIFLTAAYRDEVHRIQGYQSGAVDYLDKPINDVVLLSKVRVFLELHRHRLEQDRLLAQVGELNAGLRAANRALEEKVADLEGFSYTLSHDLRAPLRAISGLAGILKEEMGGDFGRGAEVLVNSIQGHALHMNRLLDDLLTFFRVTAAPLDAQSVDLARLARDVAEACRSGGRYPRSEIVIHALPAVIGDPTALRQLLHNLIDNALKYSGLRDVPRIEVGCRSDRDAVHCYVRDNGIGFDNCYGGKLFRVFQRLVSSAEFEGNGVGLAIVERIVRRHDGRVWAEGIPGQGATFHFCLPAPGEQGG